MGTPQLVVMAAGIGSRYGGLKQIEAVGPHGEIILDYALFDAKRAGFKRVVFIIRRDIDGVFREKIGTQAESTFEVRYAYQELDRLPPGFAVPDGRTKPWGTAHAVLCAKDDIDAPFAVINSDDFYGAESFNLLYSYLCGAHDNENGYDFCMVGYLLDNTLTEHGHVSRGVCTVDAAGRLGSVVERTKVQRFGDAVRYEDETGAWVDIDASSVVSMNMFGFTPPFLTELEKGFPGFLQENITNAKAEYLLPAKVNLLVARGKATVTVLPTRGNWLGVTYREDAPKVREAVTDLVRRGVYPSPLWD